MTKILPVRQGLPAALSSSFLLPSAVCHLPSFNYQFSIINYQLKLRPPAKFLTAGCFRL
ncbi:MAG: hypothetical protein LBH00_03965 [Planctomycetaceae bacterium]|nr:hypothetical protein [Planctomycetaceae bacterium]